MLGYRITCRHQFTAYTLFFGSPIIFCTPNIADNRNVLICLTQGQEINLDLSADPEFMLSYEDLRLRVVNDPVGQCLVVELLLRLFVLHILGASPDAVAQPMGMAAKHSNWFSDGVAASLTSLGCLCILAASRGELEASGRGSLHGHWEIWPIAASTHDAIEQFQELPADQKLQKLKSLVHEWLNFFQRTHHSSVEHLPKVFGQDIPGTPITITKNMMQRCRMDGHKDEYPGYCSQDRPQMTGVPTMDLPTRMPADALYEPPDPDAEACVTSEDAPMLNAAGTCSEAGHSVEEASVVNLPDQEAQATGSSSDLPRAPAAASSVSGKSDSAELPAPASTKQKRLIRGQALSAFPAFRRIQSLKQNGASSSELSAHQWLKFFLADAWEIQTRAMLHVCGGSCWKYNQSGTRICRHHCYHIVTLQPDDQAVLPAEKEMKMRRDGRPLNNQLYIMEDQNKGKRGRICPICVCCFETMTNYVAASALRCNFDNQSLLYLPPQSVLPLEWMPNIGSQPQYASMNRTSGDLQPKWLIATDASSQATDAAAADLDSMEGLLQELDRELQGAFQDAHNTGFYINEYTTKVNALGDKLFEGLQRIVRKITAEEAGSLQDGKAHTSTKERNKARTRAILKKLVFLLNTMQVKSGSELAFPILFDHMSFATHRCWETNMRLPFAKVLSAWQKQHKGHLKSLHTNESVAVRVGFLLPASVPGRSSELPSGWLMLKRSVQEHDSENQNAMRDHVQREQEDDLRYIYISPEGQRFTSLNQALKHHQSSKARARLEQEMASGGLEKLDNNASVNVQFTSNFEDYMHRDNGGLFKDLPLYIYNMWVYACSKPTDKDPLAEFMLQLPFDESYGAPAKIRVQRLSLVPRIPQLEGVYIPSPDVNPHLMSLIKLILFKPFLSSEQLDDAGNPQDPFRELYELSPASVKRQKMLFHDNPYDVFPAAWNAYLRDVVLPNASKADHKLARRKEWPTIWECAEIFTALKSTASQKDLLKQDAKYVEEYGMHPDHKLVDRLTIQEYVCYMTRKIVKHLDAHGRAKASPKTKSYALDANAVEDPGISRTSEEGVCEGDFADMIGPELDDELKLKPGDAPLQVYHPLTSTARIHALLFQRLRTTKFVKEMIDNGMLKILASVASMTDECERPTSPTATCCDADQMRLKDKLPIINQALLDAQRASMEAAPIAQNNEAASLKSSAAFQPSDGEAPAEAYWQTFPKPSVAMAHQVREFEESATGFKLSAEQKVSCRWFGEAMDGTLQDEEKQIPIAQRQQRSCLLIGAGGTGKTTVILRLMLTVFCHFFPGSDGEERYLITTFSHAQSDAISNDHHRATTSHAACSYRVASMRNRDMALKTREVEMKKRWMTKLLLIQDEISLVPCLVENMMLYRSMRAREGLGLDPVEYASPHKLFGCMPIVLIAGDFMQIRPCNELSLGDDLIEIGKQSKRPVLAEHFGGRDAVMSITTVVHLKKTNRFQDQDLPAVTAGMRSSRPAAPMSEDLMQKLRDRRIETRMPDLESDLFRHGHVVGMYWENIARSMVERAHRDAKELDVPLYCLQAADKRHRKRSDTLEAQLTHQLLTIPNLHKTGKLPGMLLLHESMTVRLSDVLAPKHGLVKDKLAIVLKIDLHQNDQVRLKNLPPGFRQFFPEFMAKGVWVKVFNYKRSPMKQHLLQEWELKGSQTHACLEANDADSDSVIFIELVHANFKVDIDLTGDSEKIDVIRWQFPLTHGMLRTAFGAQGLTLEGGVVVDLRRQGGLDDDDWWLAIYVMLSRARKLTNMILLGFTAQVEELLRRGPPANLIKVTERLEEVANATMTLLADWPAYNNATGAQ